MKTSFSSGFLFVVLILVVGCKSKGSIPFSEGDTSANALDWPGQYKGILPCANCEGIETSIVLYKEGRFLKTTRYLGKGQQEFVKKGKFQWNKEGSIVRLSGIKNGPNQYLVGENQLFQLDMEGNRVKGELADHYSLKKATSNQNP